jgi:hypothetical protein
MNYTDYARLGQSCQTSMDTLVDNRKFFSINDPIYDLLYTKMKEYPLSKKEDTIFSDQLERPEEIKTGQQKITQPELYSSCCGKK